MVIPFKLIFRQPEYQQTETEIGITNFVPDEMQLYRMTGENVPEVTENIRLTLQFTCEDETARLYMDGLDTIPIRYLEVGEDDIAYLSPSKDSVTLYDNDSKNPTNSDGYYPFIPGYYRIKVVVQDTAYYSWIKVKPKQINEEQWISMRDNVEETLNGLAQDLIRKNASLGFNSSLPIPIHILRKLYIIKKDYQKWIAALKAIQNDPRMRICKEYNLVPEGKPGEIDSISIRYRSRHPESRDHVYTPKHTRNYNLTENKWIKKILRFIVKEMSNLLEYLENHKTKVQKEIKREQYFRHHEHVEVRVKTKVLEELMDYERFVRHVRSECLLVLQTDWIKEVEETQNLSVPHVLHLDVRYRQLYNLYRLLKNEELTITLDTNYDYYWKRTDLLYEIWGFLQLIKGIQHELIGFEVVKGWIFDMNPNLKTIQVPFLESGTVIEFKKGTIKLCLVYDEVLPFKQESTILSKPIYVNRNHNRPDARMDLYDNDEYIGTIMVDFKYRPLRFIWDESKLQGNKQLDSMRQLISYRSNVDSFFLYRKKFPGQWYQFKPVHEVLAVYPKHIGNMEPRHSPMESYRIRLTELTPLEENESFYQGIANAIQKVIEAYQGIFQGQGV